MKLMKILAAVVLTLMLSVQTQAETHEIVLDHVVNGVNDSTVLSDTDLEFHFRVTNDGTESCFYNPSMAYRVYSSDTAEWDSTVLGYDFIYQTDHMWFAEDINFDDLFAQAFSKGFSLTGADADTIGFAGISFGPSNPGIFEGMDSVSFFIKINLTAASVGKEICIDTAGSVAGFEWGWYGLSNGSGSCTDDVIIPNWDGPYCFTIVGCCGLYTSGETGNCDCDDEGKINLADITRLADHINGSGDPLCCEDNGDVNGDSSLTSADITRLIDRVYGSKAACVQCQ